VQIQFGSYPINFTLIYLNSFWSTDSLREAYSVKRVLQAQRWWFDNPLLFIHKLPFLRVQFEYMNRIASRETCSSYGENRTSSYPYSFAYCIVLFYRNIRSGRAFRPILGPTTPQFDPRRPLRHFRRDCRKDHDKVIPYFRVSLRSSNTRTFGNWRTVENVSATYLFVKLLGRYALWMK